MSQDISDLIRNYNDIKRNYNNIVDQVISKQNNIMSLFKKIDIKQEATTLKHVETEQFDMASILDLYTRNDFYKYGEDNDAVLVVQENVYSEIQKILLSAFSGKNVYINLRDYQDYELEKTKLITDILLESFTKYKEEISKKVEESKNKLDSLLKHIEEKKPLKILNVSKDDIRDLEEPKVIRQSLNVFMNSDAMEKIDELSLDNEYKTTMLYSTMHDIEEKQNEVLTKEERTGVLIYKTQLYRAINPIISYIRANDISYDEMYNDENILGIIENAYREMNSSSLNETEYKQTGISEIDSIFDKYKDNLGIPPIEDYKKIVLNSIPLIDSAFNKISIEEDMVLYRGVPSNNETYMNMPNQYLSTSMSPRIALDFLERETNQKGQIKTFYKIILPAGSHALFYTRELLTGKLSSEEAYPLYGDAQREVLIDTSMFDFEELKRSQFYAHDYIGGYKTEDMPIEYIEIVAHPKTIEYKASIN